MAETSALQNDPIHAPNASELIRRIASLFDAQEEAAARIALATYRLLAKEDDVPVAAIARAASVETEAAEAQVADWPAVFRGVDGAVIGFWGLTGREMGHHFAVEGKARYTWCAWDALFIPELIGKTAEVESRTAIDNRTVHLHAAPDGVTLAEPAPGPVHLSFRLPAADGWRDDVVTNFCHHCFFLVGDERERWLAANPDGVTLSLEDAFAAGKAKNRRQFGAL